MYRELAETYTYILENVALTSLHYIFIIEKCNGSETFTAFPA